MLEPRPDALRSESIRDRRHGSISAPGGGDDARGRCVRRGSGYRMHGCGCLLALLLSGMPFLEGHAQHNHHHNDSSEAPRWATQYDGLHFPISTTVPEAQRLFDQGLLMLYAFNQGAALEAFTHATHLDPDLAMAHWGVAMAEGPYYNAPPSVEKNARGHAAITEALRRVDKADERESAYIHALAQRYSASATADLADLQRQYAAAMQALSDRYPDDLDAAVLYAESRMLMNPWRLWEESGQPAPGTLSAIDTLEGVLQRDPDHVGANHLYIHAMEASPAPGRALASAMRLEALGLDAGHLAHMPGHIYLRVGDYTGVVRSNRLAVASDEAFARSQGKVSARQHSYAMHNLEFVIIGHTELGDWPEADRTSRAFHEQALARVADAPEASPLLARRMATLLRFGRWREMLAMPQPGREHAAAHAYFHYAQGIAYAASGQKQQARRARDRFIAAAASVDADSNFRGNAAGLVLAIAAHALDARIALIDDDTDTATASLRQAIALQDGLAYDEPASWDFPLREWLGMTLLRAGEPARAEAVFRQNLIRLPRHPRSLYGLAESLRRQDDLIGAALVEQQFRRSWTASGDPFEGDAQFAEPQ